MTETPESGELLLDAASCGDVELVVGGNSEDGKGAAEAPLLEAAFAIC